MRRRFAAGLLVPVLLAGACSGEQQPGGSVPQNQQQPGQTAEKLADEQPDDARLRVIEAGAAGGNFYAYVENPEDREVAGQIEFTAFDAAGKAFKESSTTKPEGRFEVFPPKSTIAVALFLVMDRSAGEKPKFSRIEAEVTTKKRSAIPQHQQGRFEAGPVTSETRSGSIFAKTIVEVTNGYPEKVSGGVLVVMCKDAAGKVVNTASTQFSAEANGKKAVDLSSSGGGSGCKAYPRMSSSTRFGETE
ncbi:hypothetical protein [Kibdelosporangium phytohabitans]|nr:hypothetical protein [Kibdelosporangium phytohabitans]MBE1465083.1 hypothetical protein [Kibdelosporangium phytohabitans]